MKNRWKRAAAAAAAFTLGAAMICTSACGKEAADAEEAETGSVTEALFGSRDTLAINQDNEEAEEDAEEESEETTAAVITLSDRGSTVTAAEGGTTDGVKIDGDTIEITAGGTYEVYGTLSDGQIYVEAPDTDTVTLILDGVDLTNETEPAIWAESAKKLRVRLAEGSENLLQSGTSMPEEADENASGGALFSRDDLVINGSGTLTVNGYIKDGIHGNDDVKIKGGTIEVNAAHHAVKANETLTVSGGDLTVTADEDGLHSEGDLVITGGDLAISVGDDGIHADHDLTIEDGTIVISRSYEGIEANRIYVEGGDLSITSRDDGFNAYGGQSLYGRAAEMGITIPGMEGYEEDETESEDPQLIIDDGTIYVDAGGDGLDSNGDLIVNGGSVIVDGPESSANGALDSGTENGGVCQINGGTVLAIGASGMAERFGDSSSQASFRLKFDTADAGTRITIADASGEEIFSYTSAKTFASLVFSSPEIEVGEEYTVTVGRETYTFTQDSISYANTSGSGMSGSSSTTPGGRSDGGRSGGTGGRSGDSRNGTTPGSGSGGTSNSGSSTSPGGSGAPEIPDSNGAPEIPEDGPAGTPEGVGSDF